MSKQTIQKYKKRMTVLKQTDTNVTTIDSDKLKLALGLTAAVSLLAGLCIGLEHSRRK
jgi:hypothetical protein